MQMQRGMRAIAAKCVYDNNPDGFANTNTDTSIHEISSDTTAGLMYTNDFAANTCTCPDHKRQLDHADQRAKDLDCYKPSLSARIYRGEVVDTSATRPLHAEDNDQLVLRPFLEEQHTPKRLAQLNAFLKGAEAHSASGTTSTRNVLETVMKAIEEPANTLTVPRKAPRVPTGTSAPGRYDMPHRIGDVPLERQRSPGLKRVGTLQDTMGEIPDEDRRVR